MGRERLENGGVRRSNPAVSEVITFTITGINVNVNSPVASSSANPFPLADPSSQLQFRQESQPQFTQLQPQSTQLQTQQAPAQQKENYLVPVPAYGSRWLESPSPITTTDEQTVLEGEGDTDESTVAEFLSPEKVVMRDLVLDAVRSADAKEHLFTLGGDFAKEVLGIIQQVVLSSQVSEPSLMLLSPRF